jgi:hypothetical protein
MKKLLKTTLQSDILQSDMQLHVVAPTVLGHWSSKSQWPRKV